MRAMCGTLVLLLGTAFSLAGEEAAIEGGTSLELTLDEATGMYRSSPPSVGTLPYYQLKGQFPMYTKTRSAAGEEKYVVFKIKAPKKLVRDAGMVFHAWAGSPMEVDLSPDGVKWTETHQFLTFSPMAAWPGVTLVGSKELGATFYVKLRTSQNAPALRGPVIWADCGEAKARPPREQALAEYPVGSVKVSAGTSNVFLHAEHDYFKTAGRELSAADLHAQAGAGTLEATFYLDNDNPVDVGGTLEICVPEGTVAKDCSISCWRWEEGKGAGAGGRGGEWKPIGNVDGQGNALEGWRIVGLAQKEGPWRGDRLLLFYYLEADPCPLDDSGGPPWQTLPDAPYKATLPYERVLVRVGVAKGR